MKPFMVFRERIGKEAFKTYKLNESGDYYISLTDPSAGFPLETINKYVSGFAFTFFDSIEETEMFIKEAIAQVVSKESADVFCPKCSRGYEGKDNNDEYNFQYEWEYKKTCACGHVFTVKAHVTTHFNVE